MTPRQSHQVLAAPVLGERGGGVGQVSQLLWRTMQDEWGATTELVTLLRNGHPQPAVADKIRFGITLTGRQLVDRPEWILFSHLGLARVERLLPRQWAAPYGVFLHGIECWKPLSASDRDILRRAALRVANSKYTAQRAVAANPDIGEVAVCPLALPAGAGEGAVPRANRSSTPTVLVVGRLSSGERYKGHEPLIRAWPAVAARVPAARLVIVGEGDDLPRLKQIASGLAAAGAVEFTGFVPRAELDRRYAEATVFALPSRGEGFGLVYLEAMAYGLPCVGSIHDAASEIIVNGETGLLVDPGDLDAMGRAIGTLLEHPEKAGEMGEAGRARLHGTFSYDRFRDRMAQLIHSALAMDVALGSR